MKCVVPVKVNFVYLDKPESSSRLQIAYNRIFEIAKQNILRKRNTVVDKDSERKLN